MATSTPIRKKRNFKGLGLSAQALAPPPPEPEPLPILGPSLSNIAVGGKMAPVGNISGPSTASTADSGASGGSNTSDAMAPSIVAPPAAPVVGSGVGVSGGGGGGKKKRPGPLSLGPKTIGGSGAADPQEQLKAANGGIGNGNVNQGKNLLDESGMLTIPAGSGSAPVTATLGGGSPFRLVYRSPEKRGV